MTWKLLEEEAPSLAKLGRHLLVGQGLAFLATISKHGHPRVHPVCPRLTADALLLAIIRRSPKHRDLMTNGRVVLHALPGDGHAEFWVEGVARPTTEAILCGGEVGAVAVPSGDTLFELEVAAAHGTIYRPGPDNLPLPDRRHWVHR